MKVIGLILFNWKPIGNLVRIGIVRCPFQNSGQLCYFLRLTLTCKVFNRCKNFEGFFGVKMEI